MTIWKFLGIPQNFQKNRDARVNRNGNNPDRERKPPLKRLADPENLKSENPAIKAAAEIKTEEDLAPQKVKAIKYLATIGCRCYPQVKQALLAALDDCTEEVRYQAAVAFCRSAGNPCRLAAATYLLQPGTPFIYYGEEIGMRGAQSLSGDPKLRTPMSWTSSNTGSGGFTTGTPFRALSSNVATNNVQTQQASSNSLLNWYKTVIAVRQANPALRSGTHVSATAAATTLSFQRTTGNQRAVVMINYGSGPALISAGGLPANGVLTEVFPQPGINNANIDAGGTASASIPAQSLRVFVIAI